MLIVNDSPFAAAQTVLLDKDGAETLIVALGATWDVSPQGDLSVAAEQPPLAMVDTFRGEPDSSSILQDAELGPPRPRTDVFLAGSAVAPHADTRELDVRFRVGPVCQVAKVFGRRTWTRRLGVTGIFGPEPFDRIPLTWENAFGGSDVTPRNEKHHGWEDRNPVGRGYFAKRTRADLAGAELPNVEAPDQPLRRPGQRVEPVGFGPVGRHWQPRLRHAGTYDEDWQRDRIPLLPHDFDERFHNAAPERLIADGHLAGDEPVEVVGCTPEGRLAFALPALRAHARVDVGGDGDDLEMALECVRVDTDAMQLRLVWKASKRIHGRALHLRRTEIGLEEARA